MSAANGNSLHSLVVLSDSVSLYCGDCREIIPTLGKVDAVVTDPPYGMTDHEWDKPVDPRLWMVAKSAIVTASEPFATATINAAPLPFSFDCVWIKGRASGALFAAHQPMRRHERVLVFGRPNYTPQVRKLKPAEYSRRDKKQREIYGDTATADTVLEYASVQCRTISHPTEKPVPLMMHLVSAFTADTETVLDPFMGSGTTGIACIRTGRRFVGIEKDPTHYATARKRLENEMRQGLLPLTHNASLERAERSDDTLQDFVRCENCGGSGVISYNPNLNPNSFPGTATAKCTRCGGTGIEDTANAESEALT